MHIEWKNLDPLKKSLETFLQTHINLEKSEDSYSNHVCWAEFSSEIQSLYDPKDRNIGKAVKDLLDQIHNQKMRVFFHRGYKTWYTVMKIGEELWSEESLYYADLPDLWDHLLLKLDSFCYRNETHGFNVEFYENVQDQVDSAFVDYNLMTKDITAQLE